MRTPREAEPGTETVLAAQRGDRRALDRLVSAYLPLVYNIVGRAMSGHPDVDDVVQETMIRALRAIADLRDPRAFRSWLVAIAMRQVRDSYRSQVAQSPADQDTAPAAASDFEDLAIWRLGLSGQRRETAEATRWLDDEDRALLALWWQEAAGTLERADLVQALGQPAAHVAVAVSRMRERLDVSRMVVHALRQLPACPRLLGVAAGWDGQPSPLWRKRLARHVRNCPACLPGPDEMVPAERLLIGLGLVPVPALLSAAVLSHAVAPAVAPATGNAGRPGRAGHPRGHLSHASAARHSRLLPKAVTWMQPKVIAASVAIVTCVAGGTAAAAVYADKTPAERPAAAATLAPRAPLPSARPARTVSAPPAHPPAPREKKASPPPPAVVSSAQKGVSTWSFTGVDQALAESGASWYYNWAASPAGIAAPGVSFVPMIWGAASVTPATLDQVRQEGSVLLGFNEPDMSSQSNMTVAQALDLWPRLMATGMTLGSPAVSANAATPGSWLDQFMQGAKARGYRVNFITVHWYGGDFDTVAAVSELQQYLQAIYDRYHLPIWLTEFALTNFSGATPTFPPQSQQAAFVTAAARMLAGLSYVQRYAWFALPVSAGSGTTGLFASGAVATPVGRAFEAAGKSG
ncbi:MAG TPA: sigma-70 family RNA polymerase sigma factor [Trebonia sp.]|nr:sigma-70 family RNA polymerase sigma factor [Trebonia sp.]